MDVNSTAEPASPRNEASAAARSTSPGLRHRLARASTFAEGVRASSSPLPRRRSSIVTDTSFDDGRSVRSIRTMDSLFLPRATGDEKDFHHEPTHWESLPLLFAIVPAVGGVFFKNGSQLATDASLLVLAAIYLNWCLRSPWDWYHSAQSIKVVEPPPLDTIVEDDLEDDEADNQEQSPKQETEMNGKARPADRPSAASEIALQELRVHELCALLICFLGPLLGAYLLHLVRAQLSSHLVSEGLVSNMNLTLFVLCAELRPSRYLIKMIQSRTLQLQRLVRSDPHAIDQLDKDALQNFGKRLDEIESAVADGALKNESAAAATAAAGPTPTQHADSLKKLHSNLQSQIDPLNRAVRRYEKRTTAQAIQLEGRLQDLETRLKEALSLAAVAANYSQKPSAVASTLQSLTTLFMMPLQVLWVTLLYPLTVVNRVQEKITKRLGLRRPARPEKPRKVGRGMRLSNGEKVQAMTAASSKR